MDDVSKTIILETVRFGTPKPFLFLRALCMRGVNPRHNACAQSLKLLFSILGLQLTLWTSGASIRKFGAAERRCEMFNNGKWPHRVFPLRTKPDIRRNKKEDR